MITIIIGDEGTGKTKDMIDLANEKARSTDGSVVFLSRSNRLMFDLAHEIRYINMEDYTGVNCPDEYIGFLYGVISSDHDIENIYSDSVLKQSHVNEDEIPAFLQRLRKISEEFNIAFTVSASYKIDKNDPAYDSFNIIESTGCGC